MSSNNDLKSWFFLIIGILICLASIVGGLYVGLWLCFIGGIVDVVNGVKGTPVEAMTIAIGFGKIVMASFAGWVTLMVGVVFGKALIDQA